MKTIFDVGMYDASDARYYLECGYRVVAVEANPALADRALKLLRPYVNSGQLRIVNAAISSVTGKVELSLSAEDLGSSSVLDRVVPYISTTVEVESATILDLFEEYGVPHYLKIDIEESDGLCVLPLTRESRPRYLSFEVADDVEVLVEHAQTIGYERFKVVNQRSFLELEEENRFYDRAVLRLLGLLGYSEPRKVRRAGRFFVRGHSSGPLPWFHRSGKWRSGDETIVRCQTARMNQPWYDIHAC